MRLTAVVARGAEEVLARELHALGAREIESGRGIVAFAGDLETGYRACLWLRTASRVLLPLTRFSTGTPEAHYAGVRGVEWREHLSPGRTLAVECAVAAGVSVHTHYLALKTKDAVCDQLRERTGERPSIDRERPDVRLHVHVDARHTTVSLDLGGQAMHRRGYRPRGVEAPVKETLAAALLLLARWDERAARGESLVDPLCGSGTFLVEAALIAGDIAPGLLRAHHGMLGWRGHDAVAWRRVHREAEARATAGAARIPAIHGFDASADAVHAAREAARRAGVAKAIHVERTRLRELQPPAAPPGLVVANPPYGERLGRETDLETLYAEIGDVLRRRFPGWTGCVLTGSPALAKCIGLRAAKKHVVWNGAIECRFLEFPIDATPVRGEHGPGWRAREPGAHERPPVRTATREGDAVSADTPSNATLAPAVRRRRARRPRGT